MFSFLLYTEPLFTLYKAVSCSIQSRFQLYTALLFAPKQNFKVDICQGLHNGPDVIKFLINMIFLKASRFVTKVLLANVLCTVTGLTKLTGS